VLVAFETEDEMGSDNKAELSKASLPLQVCCTRRRTRARTHTHANANANAHTLPLPA
jgi:hypothetical protein